MKPYQKYFSVCLLALLTQAAFAQAPNLGAASNFAVLSAADGGGGAVTCTDSIIIGDVGSSGQPASIVQVRCKISGAIIAPVSAGVVDAFDSAYAALKTVPQCTETFTATSLGNHTFTPGVYCFTSAVTETNAVWTLQGGSNDLWIFKIGTQAAGALTGTGFSVLMDGGQACNVYWWVDAAVTMTTSGFQGTILAGKAITATGLGSPTAPYNGDALAKAAVTLTNFTVTGCQSGTSNPPAKQKCNQGVGNGPEGCDPGNSNQGNPLRSNDELRGKLPAGTPGNPGRKGGNK
jgi:Ice-binding-like